MDWSNERYVRVYVRDTADWLLLSWEARALWLLLLRKLDRAGVMDLGRHGARGVAAAVGMPFDVVERALPELLEDGCIVVTKRDDLSVLVAPNYLEAQEAVASDAQRKRESRARRREHSLNSVTKPDDRFTNPPVTVTRGHAVSRAVTIGHSVPCCTVPSQAVPKEPPIPPFQDPDPLAARPAPAEPILVIGSESQPETPSRKRQKPRGATKPSDPSPEEGEALNRVLGKLSANCGRSYKVRHEKGKRAGKLTGGARLALDRLRETDEESLRLVVWERSEAWARDEYWNSFLQPSTLFGPVKFEERVVLAKSKWARREEVLRKATEPPAGSILAMVATAMEERDGVG